MVATVLYLIGIVLLLWLMIEQSLWGIWIIIAMVTEIFKS
jgi:hypothetical protein